MQKRLFALVVSVWLAACGTHSSAPVTAAAKANTKDACAACDELDRQATPARASEAAKEEPKWTESTQWTGSREVYGVPLARSEGRAPTRVFLEGAPPDRWAVRRIGSDRGQRAAGARPKRTRLVDIDLVRAPFDEAARLLSDAGRFNVVVEAPSASAVTVRLKAIEPYDALVVLAEARGLYIRFEHGVVVVGGGTGASQTN